jgi:predicted ester cyclase
MASAGAVIRADRSRLVIQHARNYGPSQRICAGETHQPGVCTMSEQNKKTIRKVREEAPANPSVLDGLYTDDYVYHGIPLLGDLKGPGAFKGLVSGFSGAIADFREEVMDQIAEGDKVVTRLSGSGRHTGEVMGAAPTGKVLKWRAVIISRFVGGKIAEEWAEFDGLSFLQQLGIVPQLR